MHFAIGAVHCDDLILKTPILCNIASGNGAKTLQVGGRLHSLGSFLQDMFNSMEEAGRKTGTKPRTFDISNPVFLSGA